MNGIVGEYCIFMSGIVDEYCILDEFVDEWNSG